MPVEVTLRFRLERCDGPLTLGNLLYTTTLLPGEKVRLLTKDQNSRLQTTATMNSPPGATGTWAESPTWPGWRSR